MQWASVVHGNADHDKLLFVEAIPNEVSPEPLVGRPFSSQG